MIKNIISFFQNNVIYIVIITVTLIFSFVYYDSIFDVIIESLQKFIFVIATTIFFMKNVFNNYYRCLFDKNCNVEMLTPAYRKSALQTFYVIILSVSLIVSL